MLMLKVKSPMAARLLQVGWSAGLSLVDKYIVAANASAKLQRIQIRGPAWPVQSIAILCLLQRSFAGISAPGASPRFGDFAIRPPA